MLASIFTLWGFKMAAYVAVLLALGAWINRVGKDRDAWKAKCGEALRESLQAQNQVICLQEDIKAFSAATEAARLTAIAAVNDARAIKERFAALTATIQATPVPPDAEGALAWMADVATQIQEAARA